MANHHEAFNQRLTVIAVALLAGTASPGVQGTAAPAVSGFTVRVREISRTVDLERGGREFLVIVADLIPSPGAPADSLKHLQPRREHFTLLDDRERAWDCEWLRGATTLDEPRALRLHLGFPVPGNGARHVSLSVRIARPTPERRVSVILKSLAPKDLPMLVKGDLWQIEITGLARQDYLPPAIPRDGRFVGKGTSLDRRIFRLADAATEKATDQAIVVSWRSPTATLFDDTTEVAGLGFGAGGSKCPLLSVAMERRPSRAVDPRSPEVRITGQWFFQAPPKVGIRGLQFTFIQREVSKESDVARIDNLPVPGAGPGSAE